MGKKDFFLLTIFTLMGTFLRFYNLSWGEPYFFHPDERNIASAITQLSFPSQMNPHFFAYGSIPIYVVSLFTHSFKQAIILGRFLSACCSLALIPLLYLIGKKIHNTTTGLLTAFFATTSVGFIQYAHFSTFEMWLTFFGTVLFYFCLCFFQKPTMQTLVFIGCTIGILCGIKVSSIVLLVPVMILLFFTSWYKNVSIFVKIKNFAFSNSIMLFFGLFIFLVTNPFVLLSENEFITSMYYESSVVLHTLPVFYTQGFNDTTPILYQFLHIFPFLLNPLLLIIFIPSFVYVLYKSITKRWFSFFLLILFFITLLCSQEFFYAKWTRYMIPTLPFIYIVCAIMLTDISTYFYTKNKIGKIFINILLSTLILTCSFYAICFVSTVYQKDSRIEAMEWAKSNIPSDTPILSEVYDLGIVPFNATHPNITLFNFYDLDSDNIVRENFQKEITHTSFVILPSQRIIKTRLQNPKQFPNGYSFYTSLLSEKNYQKIYETPCDIFCKIVYMGDPIFALEETTTVFDRPVIFIFKKI